MILLDTHVVVWLAGEEHRLSSKAKTAIDEARQTEQGLAISDFTLYELSTLYRKRQFTLAISPETFLSEVEQRFIILPITSRICLGALSLPADYPKDPADRIIGATALVEGLTLVTADTKIRSSRVVPTIW
ncbi:MAG: type II toxin-antitoxin system VapC family toxin [Candidatus Sulfotelmatobacter sp.]